MKIKIAIKRPMRLWQSRLAETLRASGHEVVVGAVDRRPPAPCLALALAAQQRVFGPRPSSFDTTLVDDDAPVESDDAADLVIALDGVPIETGARTLEPIFDGRAGENALLSAIARGGSPDVRVLLHEGERAYDIVAACLAIEDRLILTRSLDQVLSRLVTLLHQGVHRVDRTQGPHVSSAPVSERRTRGTGAIRHIASGVARKLGKRMSGDGRRPNHWRIAYRLGADARPTTKAWPAEAFAVIEGDDTRFFADPIPFEHEGRRYVFLEDYPYATGKAVIAVVEIGAEGTVSVPRTVLEQACHLSYPYIIRHRGETYMLPEMSGARRLQLFRADPFPDRWVPDRILLDDVVAADATPVEHDGRWWMFATLSDDGGSTWDRLCLFHAPDLLGPWTAHADNPVLVDAGAARPAGAMWHADGVLMRVAQDCRTGYGHGLAICRVDRLDTQGYHQTVVSRLEPPDGYGADGVHTLGRAGGLEVIDLRFSSAFRSGVPSRDQATPPSRAHD